MGTDGKSDRDLLVEVHTHLLGKDGVMDRLARVESKQGELHDFKVKFAAVIAVIGGAVTLAFNAVVTWFKAGGNGHN